MLRSVRISPRTEGKYTHFFNSRSSCLKKSADTLKTFREILRIEEIKSQRKLLFCLIAQESDPQHDIERIRLNWLTG